MNYNINIFDPEHSNNQLIIQKLIKTCHKNSPHRDFESLSNFIQLLIARFSKDYLGKSQESDLLNIINNTWEAMEEKKTSKPVIKIQTNHVSYHKTERLFITIISNDRPYLVDSLQTLLTKWNLKPQFILHPVFNIRRKIDKKSGKTSIEHVEANSPKHSPHHLETNQESVVFIQTKNHFSKEKIDLFTQDLSDVLQLLNLFISDQDDIMNDLNSAKNNLSGKNEVNNELKILPESSSQKLSPSYPQEEIRESIDFLKWLKDQHFIFLGSRYFSAQTYGKDIDFFCIEEQPESSKGIFKAPLFSELDSFVPFLGRSSLIPDTNRSPTDKPDLIRITKTSQRSSIQRASRLDLIEVLDWSQDGQTVKGIYQFVGIFKKELFNTSAFSIPILREKVKHIFDRFNFNPEWYDGKSLLAIIDSIPRDEMFYMQESTIYDICKKVLGLQDDLDLSLFVRADPYGHYLTMMIYLIRERFSPQLKEAFAKIITKELNGTISSQVVQIGDLPFARIIYIVHFAPPHLVYLNHELLEDELKEASLSWYDRLERYAEENFNEEVLNTLNKYRNSFSGAYQDNFTSTEIYDDIQTLETINDSNPIDIRLYQQPKDCPLDEKGIEHLKISHGENRRLLCVKIYHLEKVLLLSDLLPILSNFGLKVLTETTYITQKDDNEIYIHYFNVSIDATIPWESNLSHFQEGFRLVWAESYENDKFNQLILSANLTARQILILRAYIKYLMQSTLSYSISFMENALIQYPTICQTLIELFEARFHPTECHDKRPHNTIIDEIKDQLDTVTSLIHDRIIRHLLNAIESTLRTNYYQYDNAGNYKNYLSIKLECQKINDLPAPRPLYEIFVYSTHMEGIHLRGGKVARGGIRWSDRHEDYRTEVLSLMKAQTVKNTVIVPLGSKGGFVVKHKRQKTDDRAEQQKEVIYCYQTLIRGLLDLTDNYINGKIISPPKVRRYDSDDPYLVVAADKGTATFSDIANAISKEYNFWLGDAFASGGSAGYDHKSMGITSRGAWESVKRHFREIGRDCQKDPFTVIGIGDMSGDVFGNGMLRFPTIRLVAAFDHRHIFIDPNPDGQRSYDERKRLFQLPRSSWNDYNRDYLSPGGNIYSRSDKSIRLSPEARSLLSLENIDYTPDDLVKSILKAKVDLLWFGGIGTFIKASYESNSDVGDISNKNIRVNGRSLGATIISEGANLALTQQGRIEYALHGGRLNTDAIDNSAGVDCSDHEVNLKILFSSLTNPISEEKRDEILKIMTDDVANLVLQNNYHQTQILTILQSWGKKDLSIFQNLIKILESEVQLNRTLEGLPDDEIIDRRRAKNQGITRPELSVLLAYSKIALYNKILASTIVTQPFYDRYLIHYFPNYIRNDFKEDILKHPLHKEIIATVLSNLLINRVGPTFVYELSQVSGCSIPEVVHAFFVTAEVLDLERWWSQIDKLDNRLLTEIQTKAYTQIASLLRISVLRLLSTSLPVVKENLHAAVEQLTEEHLLKIIEEKDNKYLDQEIQSLKKAGIPQAFAERLALLPYFNAIIDIALIQPGHLQADEIEPREIANIYFTIRSHFDFDVLIEQSLAFETTTDWQRSAQLSLQDDIGQIIMVLTQQVIQSGYGHHMNEWLDTQETYYRETQTIITQLKASTIPDIGKLAFAVRHLQRMPEVKQILNTI